MGSEKMLNEALRQALKLQTVLLAARPQKTSAILGELATPKWVETEDDQCVGAVESQTTSGIAATRQGRQEMTTGTRNVMKGL
jgi:hypothetical protein